MSFLENTPFSLVTIDSTTGENLSPEALDNRKRLILYWKIQDAKQKCLAADINDPATQSEEALTGDEFIELLRNIMQWAEQSRLFPVLKMEKLEEIAAVVSDSPLN